MTKTERSSVAALFRPALTLAALALGASAVFAQTALELPAPSPKARVEQRVGVTDFSIDYSSPGVKGRKIWGGLLPYDELWRAGANAATKLTASRDFTFAGKTVPAGAYAFYAIPGKTAWTVILNTSANASGTTGYDQKNDVARVTITPETLPAARERLAYLFSDSTDDAVNLDLEWDTLRVRVPIKVDTKTQVLAGIDKSIADAWRPHFAAGRYLFDSNGNLDTALGYLNTSIEIKPTWWNNWIKAQVLAKKGNTAEAVRVADQAVVLGKGDTTFESFFKADIAKAIGEWQKK